jgi:hypothetical protein
MAELNEQLAQIARDEIEQARSEGMLDEDVYWMAVGAGLRYARQQGMEDVSAETTAALAALVKQVMKEPRLV